MSDIGDMFREMREKTKEHRAKMLDQADTRGWTKHTEYHFSKTFNGERFDWWPSGGKARYMGRMIYGHRNVYSKIKKLTDQES